MLGYVGIVEDFMYKGHWCNRHLNRHGYVMHPTRENQQVKNRLWEKGSIALPHRPDEDSQHQPESNEEEQQKFFKTTAKT